MLRSLFAEYARSVDEPGCFAGFERELADLPRGYLALFLSCEEAVAAGCVGLREIDRDTAEMKRLYVRPAWRGRGLGRALAEAAIGAARAAGYGRIVLDSLPKMQEARALYGSLGFSEAAPYLASPTPGADCFERRL
ncbi:MAG TPA: GNAT family N-acetyltransferase [Planctomycetota bacterium]|nr:GNAT family N-acetyltransferase [Planctomycetota bacterium]